MTLLGIRVLVVEDHPESRKLATVLLAAAGADVTAVGTAEEALEAIAARRPDVVAVDLILPRISGILLVELLKANPATRDIPCVAVTVLSGRDVERVALISGCAAYIRKPIDAESFVRTIAVHAGRAQ